MIQALYIFTAILCFLLTAISIYSGNVVIGFIFLIVCVIHILGACFYEEP